MLQVAVDLTGEAALAEVKPLLWPFRPFAPLPFCGIRVSIAVAGQRLFVYKPKHENAVSLLPLFPLFMGVYRVAVLLT